MSNHPNSDLVQTLFDRKVYLIGSQILTLKYEDAHLGNDPGAGVKLYNETSLGTNTGCRICHSLDPDENWVGPSFAGIATRAETRIPGLSAEEYLRQSIHDPDAYIVEGYLGGLMIPNLGDTLTDAEIDDLVAFLMILR